jgi:hypothetical protein
VPIGRVNGAKFIARPLPEPHGMELGGEPAHRLPATAHADRVCPPSGHSIGWTDCHAGAGILPLPHKADLLLEPNGEPNRFRIIWLARQVSWRTGPAAKRRASVGMLTVEDFAEAARSPAPALPRRAFACSVPVFTHRTLSILSLTWPDAGRGRLGRGW